ncbi:ParB/RepB/Spo0J family partition protein [Sphingobium chungbukense]|jgi:ParB family chromosome partitioning protein|uniref:Chromosome partitioning protein ParB n=1 Tax=Sphingobium chungbukense TaxID=56193 RepID=A0A0M3ALL8_9SPHN|nr:ParB/RepB/Spo0J family partition protein [Sphingobium chungbukense]KKW90843.1 chromosome partitioning protein ParB [Sphingobium chungbukense]
MAIIDIKLSQLRLSPLNARRVKPSAIESMADDITAHGMLQNLVAYEEDELFWVFAGGRRYRALKVMVKRKRITNNDLFPVEVRTKEEAIELSLAENSARENMHPADSIRAFASLRDVGLSASEIAGRFGYAESYVSKMLRLSALNPKLIDILAKDQLTLEAAKALTLSDDHAEQLRVFKASNGQAHSIRSMLTQEKLTTQSGAFLFIGRDAYADQGGTITPDLFSQGDGGYADQPEIVQELAQAKLDGIADEYRAIGWLEVTATFDQPYDLYNKGYLYPAEREPSEMEAARMAELDAQIEAIAEEEGEDSDRIEPLAEERETIVEGLRSYNADQKAVGGVALWISRDGSVSERIYRAKAEKSVKATGGANGPAPLYPNSLFADMTRIKTQIVQEAVAANPSLALDILLDSLSGQLLHGAYSFRQALELKAEAVKTDVPDEMMVTSDVRPVEEVMATRFAALPTEGRFEAIRAMAPDDKMSLLAGLVAMMVDGTVFSGGCPSDRHHQFEQIAKASQVDISDRWSAPIAVFDRMKRASLITLLRDEVGEASADNCATIKKKSDLAVNVSGRLPGKWLPEPMRIGAFDKPESDEDEAGDDLENIDTDEDADELA